MHPVTFRRPFERTSQPPRIVAIIPARYNSTRFPGKALADIDGRPMIEHVYRRASEARGVDAVIVATDDARIADAVTGFGGAVRMTGAEHRTGTDRIAEAVASIHCEIVVNVQGDEPLIDPRAIEAVVAPLDADAQLPMSTARRRLVDAAEYASRDVVKVVIAANGDALYFSRAPIPQRRGDRETPLYKHIGLYAYRRDFVMTFAALPQTPLELAESLEQLRALEHGFRIRTVEIAYDSIGVDIPDDLERVRQQLADAPRA